MQIHEHHKALEQAQATVGHVRSVLHQVIETTLHSPPSPALSRIEGLVACADAALQGLEAQLE